MSLLGGCWLLRALITIEECEQGIEKGFRILGGGIGGVILTIVLALAFVPIPLTLAFALAISLAVTLALAIVVTITGVSGPVVSGL
jgi:hypothetical protein